jgi:hypothetical protein
MTEPTIVTKAMLTFPSALSDPLDQPRNHLRYKLVVTDQDGEDIREMELLLPMDTGFKEQHETLRALLTMFNKVKQEPTRVVPEYVIFKGKQV